jgi:hypothetical protein
MDAHLTFFGLLSFPPPVFRLYLSAPHSIMSHPNLPRTKLTHTQVDLHF